MGSAQVSDYKSLLSDLSKIYEGYKKSDDVPEIITSLVFQSLVSSSYVHPLNFMN
ncbi:hypothetical protein AB837_00410 [bacterium AB1]|nr:hypothetical protein AB837_00410 [bacterium AB1]